MGGGVRGRVQEGLAQREDRKDVLKDAACDGEWMKIRYCGSFPDDQSGRSRADIQSEASGELKSRSSGASITRGTPKTSLFRRIDSCFET